MGLHWDILIQMISVLGVHYYLCGTDILLLDRAFGSYEGYLISMKDLNLVLQLGTLKDSRVVGFVVYLMGYHWYKKSEIHLDIWVDLILFLAACFYLLS